MKMKKTYDFQYENYKRELRVASGVGVDAFRMNTLWTTFDVTCL
jgi:beta-glucosidase/6-phospho-beta-glucosidase/beta-galactosidase